MFNNRTPWYARTWLTVASLIIFAPIGLFLLWRYKDWPVRVKQVLSVVSIIIFIVAMVQNANEEAEKNRHTPSNVALRPQQKREQTALFVTPHSTVKKLGKKAKMNVYAEQKRSAHTEIEKQQMLEAFHIPEQEAAKRRVVKRFNIAERHEIYQARCLSANKATEEADRLCKIDDWHYSDDYLDVFYKLETRYENEVRNRYQLTDYEASAIDDEGSEKEWPQGILR